MCNFFFFLIAIFSFFFFFFLNCLQHPNTFKVLPSYMKTQLNTIVYFLKFPPKFEQVKAALCRKCCENSIRWIEMLRLGASIHILHCYLNILRIVVNTAGNFKHHFGSRFIERCCKSSIFSSNWCCQGFFFFFMLHDPHHLSAKQRFCHKELFKAWHTRILEMGQ